MRINLDALFAAAPSPYVLLDPELRIVWANDAYLAVTNRERDALIGRLLTEEFPAPADSVPDKMLRGSFRRVFATGNADHLPLIPYPIETSQGKFEDRFWSITQNPIHDSSGTLEYILLNVMDVTDLYLEEKSANVTELPQRAALTQRAEAVATENLALGQMTDFFQSAFDQAPSFMAILNGPEHIFQIVNQSYTDLVGGRDVTDQPVRSALPDIEGQGFYDLLDKVYQTGKPISIKGMSAQLQSKTSNKPEQHFVDFICHPLKDETGATIGIFLQGHDVTGQQVAESALTATREKFRTMAQSMPNQVWTADSDGGLNWLNDRTYEFTGYAKGELFGSNWARVVHPDDLEAVVAQWRNATQQGKGYESEFRIRKADGSFRWHLVRASPLRTEDGTLAGWVGTNTDIEDRKNSEAHIAKLNATLETRVAARNRELEELHATLRQSQKMEAIGNLAGGIAHDFNNLLQVIASNLELASREMPNDSAGRTRLDQAMKSVMKGATLASQLLSFARKQPLAPVVLNLRNLLEKNDEIFQSAIGDGVALEFIFDNDLWNINADPNNLENAVLNLAINSRDAMDGQGKLTVTARNVELDETTAKNHAEAAPGQYVVLSVEDTGSGIDPDTLEHIFEPFFTTKGEAKGTGLGLSMVYGFARQSGGHMTIDSKLGVGTTMSIYLPRSLEDIAELKSPEEGGLSGGTETILLVEDDDEVRETAVYLLENLGYNVRQAARADAALDMLRADPHIDLLFTDVVMPGELNGHALAKKMHEINPDVPVLFTSGYAQDAIVHDGRLDEGVQLLSKPYTQIQLTKTIRAALGRKGTPLTDMLCDQTQDEQENPLGDAIVSEGLGILVCEDDVLIRTDMALGLQEAGYKVHEAGSAHKALEILNSETIHLLVTDIGLPDRTGEELAWDARGINPSLPVVFATGGVDVSSADALGNCKVLAKPFRDSDLLDAVVSMAKNTQN
ncbi:response regulator [Sulfitobacter sp. F26204]|uniref:response regulator n=1 Tax=Sulfitobacter sp. F26204 TaxID=2996014 RepID=UPI00225E53A7|nr:response regulator [Sulfitobacter sp. F26204]MCX7560573.1 response regulator [Sulfitobacter sp. F26204]